MFILLTSHIIREPQNSFIIMFNIVNSVQQSTDTWAEADFSLLTPRRGPAYAEIGEGRYWVLGGNFVSVNHYFFFRSLK